MADEARDASVARPRAGNRETSGLARAAAWNWMIAGMLYLGGATQLAAGLAGRAALDVSLGGPPSVAGAVVSFLFALAGNAFFAVPGAVLLIGGIRVARSRARGTRGLAWTSGVVAVVLVLLTMFTQPLKLDWSTAATIALMAFSFLGSTLGFCAAQEYKTHRRAVSDIERAAAMKIDNNIAGCRRIGSSTGQARVPNECWEKVQ